VAAKNYYFSVGGGCRQFEEMVKKDGLFDTTVEKVIKGLEPITSYDRATTYPLSLFSFFPSPSAPSDGSSNVREIIKVSFKSES
jgi:hypothetical protein